MSRTYKDKKWRLRFPEDVYGYGTQEVPAIYTYVDWRTKEVTQHEGTIRMDIAGAKSKKKRSKEDQYHFPYSTPSWWVREFMNVPKRARCRNWEKDVVKLQDIEEAPVCPDYGNKPHVYYF